MAVTACTFQKVSADADFQGVMIWSNYKVLNNGGQRCDVYLITDPQTGLQYLVNSNGGISLRYENRLPVGQELMGYKR